MNQNEDSGSKSGQQKVWLPKQFYSGTKDIACLSLSSTHILPYNLTDDNILQYDSIKLHPDYTKPQNHDTIIQDAIKNFKIGLTLLDVIQIAGIDYSAKTQIDSEVKTQAKEFFTKSVEDPENKNMSLHYLCLAILSPLESADNFLETSMQASKDFADLEKIADYLTQRKSYSKAKEIYLLSMEKVLTSSEKNEKGLGRLFNKLAIASWQNQELEETLNFLHSSLEMFNSAGECEFFASKILDKLGSVYSKQRSYKESQEFYEKSLALKKQLLGENHYEVAFNFHLQALMFDNKGDYLKAYDFYHQAKSIYEKTLASVECFIFTELLDDLSVLARNLCRYKEALDLSLLSLEYKKKMYREEENLDVATSYTLIGNVFIKLENFEEAFKYHEKSFRVRNELLPKDHPALAESSTQLGLTYRIQQKNDKSLTLIKEGLAIREKNFGLEHLDTAESLTHCGVVEVTLNKGDAGIANIIKGMDIRRKILGEMHPQYAKSLQSLAIAKVFTNKHDEAIELYEKSLDIKMEVYGYENLEVSDIFHGLAGIYLLKGKSADAVEYLSNTVEIRKKLIQPMDNLTKQLEITVNLYKNGMNQNSSQSKS